MVIFIIYLHKVGSWRSVRPQRKPDILANGCEHGGEFEQPAARVYNRFGGESMPIKSQQIVNGQISIHRPFSNGIQWSLIDGRTSALNVKSFHSYSRIVWLLSKRIKTFIPGQSHSYEYLPEVSIILHMIYFLL